MDYWMIAKVGLGALLGLGLSALSYRHSHDDRNVNQHYDTDPVELSAATLFGTTNDVGVLARSTES